MSAPTHAAGLAQAFTNTNGNSIDPTPATFASTNTTNLGAAPATTGGNSTGRIPRLGRPIDIYLPCVPAPAVSGASPPPWAHKACRDTPNAAPPPGGMHANAVVATHAKLWGRDGLDPFILTYSFLDGTNAQKQKIRDIIPEWELYAHVKFEESTVAQSKIRITFNILDGSWSMVCTRLRLH
jgi:hypothetical protein